MCERLEPIGNSSAELSSSYLGIAVGELVPEDYRNRRMSEILEPSETARDDAAPFGGLPGVADADAPGMAGLIFSFLRKARNASVS